MHEGGFRYIPSIDYISHSPLVCVLVALQLFLVSSCIFERSALKRLLITSFSLQLEHQAMTMTRVTDGGIQEGSGQSDRGWFEADHQPKFRTGIQL